MLIPSNTILILEVYILIAYTAWYTLQLHDI